MERRQGAAPAGPAFASNHIPALLCAAASIAVAAARIRLSGLPLERDEGEYALAGQLLLNGVPPYAAAYNMKLPGAYFAYAAILAVFGQTPEAIHLGLALTSLLTAAFVFLIGRDLFGPPEGAIAAAAYSVLAASSSVLGMHAHATHFVMLPVTAGCWLLLRAARSGLPSAYAAAGLAMGVGFLAKQQAAAFLAFAVLFTAWTEWKRPAGHRATAMRVSAAAAGCVAPYLAVCALMLWQGTFPRFWFWTVTYAREYTALLSGAQAMEMFWTAVARLLETGWPLWLAAAAGLLELGWSRGDSPDSRFVRTFALFSFLAVVPGFYFRPHYWVVALPAAALCIAGGVNRLRSRAPDLAIWAVTAASLAGVFYLDRDYFFTLPPLETSRREYGDQPFPEAREAARYVREHTAPGDKIAVIGSEPEIYFHAGRGPATGYIYMYGLMESQPYAARMQREMIAEIESARPAYVVAVSHPVSWLVRDGSPGEVAAWMRTWLPLHYERERAFDPWIAVWKRVPVARKLSSATN